jgi:hypothetical protein
MVALDRTEAVTREEVLPPEGERWAIDLDKLDTRTWGAQSTWPRQQGIVHLLAKVEAGKAETTTTIIQVRFYSHMLGWLVSWVPSPSGLSRTFGACSAVHGDYDREQWVLKNKRRVYLINKRIGGHSTAAEDAALRQLQADMARYLDAVAPLPIQALERLAERVRLIARDPNQQKEQKPRSS